jgi:hypothetical protein
VRATLKAIQLELTLLTAVTLAACASPSPTAPAPSPTPPPTPSTTPPPVARLSITIDSHGSSVAIFYASEITFDMSGSTGVGLHYELAFGDGSSSSGASTATHIYGGCPSRC